MNSPPRDAGLFEEYAVTTRPSPTQTKHAATNEVGGAPGILLHSAAVKTDKGALLFLGHSKAGKSTICSLLSERYETIGDDMVHVEYRRDLGWVAGPLVSYMDQRDAARGKARAQGAMTVTPIYAIMRIYQNPHVGATPIPQSKLCFHLTNAIVEGVGQSVSHSVFSALRWFKVVAKMGKEIPGWHLQFPKNHETVLYITSWLSRTDS